MISKLRNTFLWEPGSGGVTGKNQEFYSSPAIAVYSLETDSFHKVFKPSKGEALRLLSGLFLIACLLLCPAPIPGMSPRGFFCTVYELMPQFGVGRDVPLENL